MGGDAKALELLVDDGRCEDVLLVEQIATNASGNPRPHLTRILERV